MTICQRKSGGRILCIRLSGLGDVAHSLNALSLLRRERPDAYIAWAVEDRFADLLRGHPCVDELVTVPRQAWGEALSKPVRWKTLGGDLGALVGRLRKSAFDVSVDFQSSLKSAWLVAGAHADLRVGFGTGVSRELSHLVQNALVSVPNTGVHRIERNLALLAPLGIATRYAAPQLPSWSPERQALDLYMNGRPSSGPLVVVHPGTSRFAAFKRWMPERYAAVADGLVAERGARILVTYGPGEKDLARLVVADMKERGTRAPEVGGVRGLIELLRRADLFIGSDTGPMHIASALGVPVVALFGPKDPLQTGPYCSRSVAVEGKASCRPCTKRTCRDVRCMTSISADEVLGAALTVLDGGGRCRAPDGPIRKPISWPFRLGAWTGEIATCYSSPEFFTWLCDPDAILGSREAVALGSIPDRSAVTAPAGAGGAGRRFVAARYVPQRDLWHWARELLRKPGARNSWLSANALGLAGVRVPFHVCYMVKGGGRHGEQFLLREQPTDVVTLRDWLSADGKRNWTALSRLDRRDLIVTIARAVRRFHMAGYCHGSLCDADILIRPGGPVAGWEVYVTGMDRTRRVDWIPYFLRDILKGRDLRTFLTSLDVPVSRADEVRFFRAYCRGFIEERHRRHVLIRTVSGHQRCRRSRSRRSCAPA